MGTEMVDIFVGPEKQLFRLHKHLLMQKIPYFQIMFTINMRETFENAATLPEDNPEVFGFLCAWIYTNEIHVDLLPDS